MAWLQGYSAGAPFWGIVAPVAPVAPVAQEHLTQVLQNTNTPLPPAWASNRRYASSA